MARKELSIFGASFLDLLAGALGAVIILYIVVPKLNIPIEEFEKQQKLTEEINQMGITLSSLSELIPKDKLQELQQQIEKIKKAKAETEKQFEQVRNELEECKSELANIMEDYSRYKNWMDGCGFSPDDPCPRESGADVDVGFSFKDKSIVFLIDVSGSMDTNDRIGQVKAGIKMLMNTMGSSYRVDIVSYTYDDRSGTVINQIEPLWNRLEEVNDPARRQAYAYLNNLRAQGGTPTGSALRFVVQNYIDISDIVLLTDGEPSDEDMGISQILAMVRQLNDNKVRINTIGVGRDFVDNPTNEVVVFLKDLARQNDGFFIGF